MMTAQGPQNAVPRHVAIIMDGNGRWAMQRGRPRSEGHRQGVEALRRAVRAAGDLGLEVLTLYSFSSENWSRPQSEVRFLLELLRRFIRTDVAELHNANVRLMMIGDREGLEPGLRTMFEEAEALTRENTSLKLVIAFNYGSRQEITRAVQVIARKVAEGKIDPADITLPLSAIIWTRADCRNPTFSSALAASSVCPTTSSGSAPTRSSCSCRNTGLSSARNRSTVPLPSFVRATGASAG